jgi:hypothetical protein
MSTRLRSLLVALPVLALLAVPGAALAAKTRTKVVAGSKWISVELPTKNGWQASVEAVAGGPGGGSEISISANGPDHESVTYGSAAASAKTARSSPSSPGSVASTSASTRPK